MGKINDGWKSLVKKLKEVPKNSQGKAFARILQFFAVMIALTIFVRGASGVTMPKVTATAFQSGEITETIESNGTVAANNSVDIKLPAGLVVKKILAPVGTNVKVDTKLVEFDTDLLQQALLTQEQNLLKLQLELRQLQNAAGLDTSGVEAAQKAVDSAQKAVDTANSRYNEAVNTYNVVVSQGENKIAQAKAAAAQAEIDLVPAKEVRRLALEAYDAEPESPAKKAAYEEAQAEVERLEAIAGGVPAVEQEAANNNASAETARNSAKDTLDTANETLASAKETLADAQKKLEEARQEQVIIDEQNKISIQLKKVEIEKQQDALAEMRKVIDGAGVVVSTLEGNVTEISLAEGETTVEGSRIRVSTGAEGYYIECSVTSNQAKQIKLGGSMYVKIDQYTNVEAKVVTKSAPDQSGNVRVRATMPTRGYGGWGEGDSFGVTVVLSSQQYWNTVPLTAIHTDSEGQYVFILQEKGTILGTQTVAERMAITIQKQGKEVAAIDFTSGYFNDVRIVTSSSKPLNGGDWVRVVTSQ